MASDTQNSLSHSIRRLKAEQRIVENRGDDARALGFATA
jgi:hypothetical protein